MTATIKVLKRKDASSIIVAVVIAMIISQLLLVVTDDLTNMITGVNKESLFYATAGADWQTQYLTPLVSAAVQLAALEALIWLYTGARSLVVKKK